MDKSMCFKPIFVIFGDFFVSHPIWDSVNSSTTVAKFKKNQNYLDTYVARTFVDDIVDLRQVDYLELKNLASIRREDRKIEGRIDMGGKNPDRGKQTEADESLKHILK